MILLLSFRWSQYKPLARIFNEHVHQTLLYLFGENDASEQKIKDLNIQIAFFAVLDMPNECEYLIRYMIDNLDHWRNICFSRVCINLCQRQKQNNNTLSMPIVGMKCV